MKMTVETGDDDRLVEDEVNEKLEQVMRERVLPELSDV